MTDRRAALDEVHQSMHEEYHGTMRREDIIRLAREAGFEVNFDIWAVSVDGVHINKELQRFAALVAAAEREACAKLCEKEQFELTQDVAGKNGLQHFDAGCRSCAEMIRARGEV